MISRYFYYIDKYIKSHRSRCISWCNIVHRLLLILYILISIQACNTEESVSQNDSIEQMKDPTTNRIEDATAMSTMSTEPWSYYQDSSYYLSEETHSNVIRQILFLQEEETGVVKGFNLDQTVSDGAESESCGHADLEDPNGVEGIDNQFATLFRILSVIVEDTPQIAIQGAINEGRVLMMVELVGVDDLRNDDDVTLRVFRASGRPLVGNQGLISPYQTFYRDYDFPISEVTGVRIKDGELHAGPVDFEVPMDVLDANFPMTVLNGQIRLTFNEDGGFSGLLGGSVNIDKVLDDFAVVVAGNEDDLARPIFKANADMGYEDGECKEISLAFEITGHVAYAVHNAELDD